MTIDANENTAPMTDIHDIKPALAIADHWPWWVWLAIVLGVAALALLAWWLKRRSGNNVEETTAEPPLPPDVEAYQGLDLLSARGSVDPKPFYFSLSAILRRYVERRYEFPAAEMTTEELLPKIQRSDIPETLANEVKRFCYSSDPVKFADATSDQAGMNRDLGFVRQFVMQTTVVQEPQEDQHSEPGKDTINQQPTKQLPPSKPNAREAIANQQLNTKH